MPTAWNIPTIHATGDILSVTDWNTVANNESFLYSPAYALAYFGSGSASVGNPAAQVSLTNFLFQGSNYTYSLSGNSIVVPLTGVYEVNFSVCYLAIASGASLSTINSAGQSSLRQNGNVVAYGSVNILDNVFNTISGGSVLIRATGGDTVSLYAGSNMKNGAAGAYLVTGSNQTFVSIHFLGSQ